MLGKRFQQLGHLRPLEEIRRAAAEMQLQYGAVAVEQRCDEFDLAVQALQIDRRATLVARDDARAAAVKAWAQTERDVHVQRQRPRNRVGIGCVRGGAQLRLAETGVELRRGRIRGVARPVHVVACDQFRVEGGSLVHAVMVSVAASPRLDRRQSQCSIRLRYTAAAAPPKQQNTMWQGCCACHVHASRTAMGTAASSG